MDNISQMEEQRRDRVDPAGRARWCHHRALRPRRDSRRQHLGQQPRRLLQAINQFTAAIPLVVGIADFSWTIGDLSFGGIALGAVAALVIFHAMRIIGGLRGTVVADDAPGEPATSERAAQ